MTFLFSKSEQKDLLNMLGGGSEAVRYLDAVEFYIERQLSLNQMPDSTLSEQKDELSRIANKADQLSLLLNTMSLDAALTLRIAFAESSGPDENRNDSAIAAGCFSPIPPYFPNDDVLSVFMKQLDLWAAIASKEESYMKATKGARRKTARNMFVRNVVYQYYDSFGQWPKHGKSENFHSVVAKFCQIAGFNGEADLQKLIHTAINDFPQ